MKFVEILANAISPKMKITRFSKEEDIILTNIASGCEEDNWKKSQPKRIKQKGNAKTDFTKILHQQ
jgi:hypothetical protein